MYARSHVQNRLSGISTIFVLFLTSLLCATPLNLSHRIVFLLNIAQSISQTHLVLLIGDQNGYILLAGKGYVDIMLIWERPTGQALSRSRSIVFAFKAVISRLPIHSLARSISVKSIFLCYRQNIVFFYIVQDTGAVKLCPFAYIAFCNLILLATIICTMCTGIC